MLKIKAVLGFNGMPKYPIIPAVRMSGIKLGTIEMMIILTLANKMAMIRAMMAKAKSNDILKFSIKNLFPFTKSKVEPVTLV